MLTGKEKQSEETKQGSEEDSDMTQMLEFPHRKFKIIMTNTLSALTENIGGLLASKDG